MSDEKILSESHKLITSSNSQLIFNELINDVNSPYNTSNKYRCMGCMELCDKDDEFCKNCGYIKDTKPESPSYILPGTTLCDKYLVGKVLGSGGFGVTYIGWDMVLKRKIAIKEYFPLELAQRNSENTRNVYVSKESINQFTEGKKKFEEEAKLLAKFHGEKGIVNIYDTFEENDTAYIVMEYLEGETLKDYLNREGQIYYEDAVKMLMPVLESLNVVHSAGIIHRDIAPDNIFLTKSGQIKLIDFGSARYATNKTPRSRARLVKDGYSPEEQYRYETPQGAGTDVYALAAVLYKMITGTTPKASSVRKSTYEATGDDVLVPINKLVKGVPKNIENAIYNAMNIFYDDRTPDIINFMGELMFENKRRDGKNKKLDAIYRLFK